MNSSMEIKKVLLVDDDANIRMLAQMGLEGLTDWQIDSVASGQEALEKVTADRPDVILLDIMMPGMDGLSTHARLQECSSLSSIPVIFLTAKVQQQEVERYLTLGAAGVITKPFDPMELPERIQQLADQYSATA